jgi:hypothetical protein
MPTSPTPNAITVVYDPSGTLVGNSIKNEIVFPITQCAIFPKQGAFYQNGFTVTAIRLSDNVTVPLVPNVDFEWSPPYSKQIDVIGAIVYSYILLKDVSLWSSATINYQAVGCENDAILLQQIVDLGSFDRLDLNSWKSLEGDYVVSADTVRPDIFNNGRTIFLLSRLLGSISRTTLSPAVIFNDLMDRVDSVANDLGFVQSKLDSLNASYVPPDLSGYVLKSSIPTQAVAEAGTDTTPRAWSSFGVAQNATAVFNKLIVAVNATIASNYSTLNTKIDTSVTTLNNTIVDNYNATFKRATDLYQSLYDRDTNLYNILFSKFTLGGYAHLGYAYGYICLPDFLWNVKFQWTSVALPQCENWGVYLPIAYTSTSFFCIIQTMAQFSMYQNGRCGCEMTTTQYVICTNSSATGANTMGHWIFSMGV